jgi:hypothetical protein
VLYQAFRCGIKQKGVSEADHPTGAAAQQYHWEKALEALSTLLYRIAVIEL